jgi:endonuclease/exonuclease/phosphatase (EEP) superfamily protein YafD
MTVKLSGLSSILVSHSRSASLVVAALLPLVSSCVLLTAEPRALLLQADGAIRVQSLPCNVPGLTAPVTRAESSTALDPDAIRVLTWNIHKEGDAGWQRDLDAFVRRHDVVLLQEVVLQDSLRRIIEDSGMRWVMASSFLYQGNDIGVLTAARVMPQGSCTERVVEPLIRLPKSAAISWFRVAGLSSTLAVVNVHAINFSLSLGAYRAQFAALGDALAGHQGPIIFAGDLNTWTDARGRGGGSARGPAGPPRDTLRRRQAQPFSRQAARPPVHSRPRSRQRSGDSGDLVRSQSGCGNLARSGEQSMIVATRSLANRRGVMLAPRSTRLSGQYVTTVRMDSPRSIRSKPSLMRSSGSTWVIRSSMLIFPSMYQSTIFGTSLRPRAPPNAVPFHILPVTS